MKLSEMVVGFLDLETTGLQERVDKIVQFSSISKRQNPRYVDEIDIIINPVVHVPHKVASIHKLSDEILEGHPKMSVEILDQIANYLKTIDVVVTFNGRSFDRPRLTNFLRSHADLYGYELGVIPCLDRQWLDIYLIVILPTFNPIFSGLTNRKQVTIAKKLGIPEYNAHNALDDCNALSKITYALIDSDIIPDNFGEACMLQAGFYK